MPNTPASLRAPTDYDDEMSESLHERVIGAIGDQYQIQDEVGRGGMSVVYRALDPRLNRPVAVKVLPPELAYDPAIRTRFTREAQTSALLSHAHIVPIYDVGEREGIAYFVMALIGGGNLATRLALQPRQPIDEVRRMMCEVADALAYAHMRGVIHRDIKPDNILLDRETGRGLVTDFGIARAVEAGTRLTVTGMAVGTPTYMSPEQAVGDKEIDGRSDVYSLGIVAYQMLTGRVPFTAGNSMALLMKHVTETPRPISELRPDAPKAMREAIERALAKAPEDRWPTAASFRDALASEETPGASWRPQGSAMRYASPRPDAQRAESARSGATRPEPPRAEPQRAETSRRERTGRDALKVVSPKRGTSAAESKSATPAKYRTPDEIVMVPEHLAGLTPEQRADLRLWNGRVDLIDRIKTMRRYGWSSAILLAVTTMSLAGIGDVPPLILAPVIPAFMMMKTRRRARSLRESGLRIRKVMFSLRSRRALPLPPAPPKEKELEKLAPREVIDSPYGAALRRAVEDRGAILAIVADLPKAERAMLPELAPTVKALVSRVAHIAQALHRLDQSIDPSQIEELDSRIADASGETESTEGQRRLSFLKRQRSTLEEIAQRRAALIRQLDSAGLALGNLRLDLVKVRSSGLQSAFSDVSTATQEAKALSREIGAVLEAAAEVRDL